MFPCNEYIHTEIYEQNRAALRREVEEERMLRQAGLVQPGFISRAGGHAAALLGHLLVALGRRLESSERAAHASRLGAAD